MTIEARSPIVVGVGQRVHRDSSDTSKEPLTLMQEAALLAAEDARTPELLTQLDSIRVPRGMWRYSNPAALLAERFGVSGAETGLSPISGNMCQFMISDAAREIAAGRRDCVLVVGGECERSRRRLKSAGAKLGWTPQNDSKPDREFGHDATPPITAREVQLRLTRPATVFSLFENALRHQRGESLDAHRVRISELWHRFALVARDNEYAWNREAPSAEEIRAPGPDNPYIAWPYTKLLCSNMVVDMAAAAVVCSVEKARALGVPRDRWVYLHAASDALDSPTLSNRMDFHTAPSLRRAGARLYELAGHGPEAMEHVDVYSCFPAAVQLAAKELGLSSDRPLTVGGGLSFGGGPFNNYVLHAVASLVQRLRSEPGTRGMLSSVGGWFAKHSLAVYSTEPPAKGFQHADIDAELAERPARECVEGHSGEVEIETYALAYDVGQPVAAIFSCRTSEDARVWATCDDAQVLKDLTHREYCGRRARLIDDELRGFRD